MAVGQSRDTRMGVNGQRIVHRRISHEVEGWQQSSDLFGGLVFWFVSPIGS